MSTTDELLAIRCQLGETGAIDALIARWHGPLWTYARRVTGADDVADDVVQDVWMQIVRGLPGLKAPASLRAWMFSIARRRLMDRLRRQYAAPSFSDTDLDVLQAPDDALLDEQPLVDEIAQMHEALATMPAVERDTLALFYLQELSLQEMSDVLGVPIGTIKSRLFRARRQLRERLIQTRTEAHR